MGFHGTYSIGLEILLPFVYHNLCELVRMGNVKIDLPGQVYSVRYYCFLCLQWVQRILIVVLHWVHLT